LQSHQYELERLKIIESYIVLFPPNLMRHQAFAFLNIPDFFLTISIFIDPYVPIFAYILTPMIIFINLWVIWIVINPVKRQVQHILFVGVYSVITSLGMLLISEKLVYYTMKVQTPYYAIFSIGGYALVLFLLIRLHFKALYSGLYMAGNKKKSNI
jgi:hypothetical protein